nr:uncharacterized protein LOC124219686 [Neodiprion pinetum]
MLDFQLARCASPVLDTSFLIYTCTDKTLRDQHYEDLLRLYHDELSKNISLLGSVLKKPWDIFVNKVQELTVHGINAAIEAVPSAMLDSSEVFDLDVSQGDESVDIAEIFSLKPIRTKEGMHRLADVILHAVEKRYL